MAKTYRTGMYDGEKELAKSQKGAKLATHYRKYKSGKVAVAGKGIKKPKHEIFDQSYDDEYDGHVSTSVKYHIETETGTFPQKKLNMDISNAMGGTFIDALQKTLPMIGVHTSYHKGDTGDQAVLVFSKNPQAIVEYEKAYGNSKSYPLDKKWVNLRKKLKVGIIQRDWRHSDWYGDEMIEFRDAGLSLSIMKSDEFGHPSHIRIDNRE